MVLRESPAKATVIATGLFAGGILTGALAGSAAVARAQDPYAHLDLFARVLTTIQQDYVETVPTEVLVDAAIRGMVSELDSQSRWLDAEQLQHLRDEAQGTTTGLGIEVATGPEGVEVVRVMPDSPASRDGLAEGDQILEIDGRTLAGLDLGEIQARFHGERGEATRLKVLRPGWETPRTIDTTRDRVRRRVVRGERLPGDAVYVRLAQFQEGVAADLAAEVEQMAGPGGVEALGGLIVDLRDNPGGLLSEAVAVADLFLDDGIIVSTRGRTGSPEDVHRATVGGFPPELEVVVLINGLSASASEIVAGALQDTERALLVGEHTYGKGTVQQVYLHATGLAPPGSVVGAGGAEGEAVARDAALKLTVGRYYTPSGEPVAAVEGRRPDELVPWPRTATQVDRLRDKIGALELQATDRAEIDELLATLSAPEGQRAQIQWDRSARERLAHDPQLQRALALLTR
jgi:carboxyl-terminal processing protease